MTVHIDAFQEPPSDQQSHLAPVPDEAVFVTWQCRECQNLISVNPSFVHDCGIPLCNCAGDSEDMVYVGASVLLDAVKDLR